MVWVVGGGALCRDDEPVVINPIAFAEVAVRFERVEDLDEALPVADFERLDLPYAASFVAAQAFRDYKAWGGVRDAIAGLLYRRPCPRLRLYASHEGSPLSDLLPNAAANHASRYARNALIASFSSRSSGYRPASFRENTVSPFTVTSNTPPLPGTSVSPET